MTEQTGPSRRNLLIGVGLGGLAGSALGLGAGSLLWQKPEPVNPSEVTGVDASGSTQAGIARPETPQGHSLIVVADIDPQRAFASLEAIGAAILKLTDQSPPEGSDALNLLPDGPADLSVSIGVGARVLQQSSRGEFATLIDLPQFRGDENLPADALGGDLLIMAHSSDPYILEPIMQHLTSLVAGFRQRWQQLGFRGRGENGITRNPLGYHDGVIVPRGSAELQKNVWIEGGPLTNASVCVLRDFAIDVRAFRELAGEEQDAIIGRERLTGAPLSGGELYDEANITAKTPEGNFMVPNGSHVRAAHPSFTGSNLMLRRSYSYSLDEGKQGMVFISYQNDVRTFSLTQQRMDEGDLLMDFVVPQATAAFVMLPGFDLEKPLGSTLA